MPVGLPLIEISGDCRARGRLYGEQAREQIAVSLSFYHEALSGRGLSWESTMEKVGAWRQSIVEFAPDLLTEVAGIAEGANQSETDILAINARSELLSACSQLNPEYEMTSARGECTSYCLLQEATGDDHIYCGQNWDWKAGTQESVVMVRVKGTPTIVMQVEAGQVGRHGANSAGLAVNANSLTTPLASGTGVPQTFVRRRLLECRTLGEALKLVVGVHQQVATNLLLSHRDGFVIDLETTPARLGWMYPHQGLIVHGNHYEAFLPDPFVRTYRPSSPDSLYRVPRVAQALAACREQAGPDQVRKIVAQALQDHFSYPDSVCCHPAPSDSPLDQWQTLASSIVDLTTGEYLVSAGPPCLSPHRALPWNLYDDS